MKKANVLIVIFIVIVALVLAVVLLACTVFVVRHIQVESDVSSPLISDDAIITSADISIGRSIIAVNKEKVASNIEKDHPYVNVTYVERKFPNTIVLNVTLRFAIMYVTSKDGASIALLDSDLKVLEVRPIADAESLHMTTVTGISFDISEEGADTLVGTFLQKEDDEKLAILSSIAQASDDQNLDLSRASFKTFFQSIEIASYDKGFYAYLLTNTGVTLVLDTGLSTSVYEQLSLCMYFYHSTEVDIDKSSGYIALDKDSNEIAYKWIESFERG